MSVQCPYCGLAMELKGVRPGTFGPRCGKCGQKFALIVAEDPNIPPNVLPLSAEKRAARVAQTAAPVSSPIAHPGDAADAIHAMGAGLGPGDSMMLSHASMAGAALSPQGSMAGAVAGTTMAPGESSAAGAAYTSGATYDSPATAVPLGSGPSEVNRDISAISARFANNAQEDFAADEPISEPPTRLGGYEIITRLGQGGMGAVYLARQVSLDRNVAVKVLQPALARDTAFVARFTREAYAAAQLTHHNVVQIHDIGEQETTHFFSMEFVEGRTLGALIKEEGKIDAEVAVGYVLQAARGLKYAHDHGMIHRDIKPDNLLLNDQGMVKVADLGLVKRRGETEITHSPDSTKGPGSALAAAQAANRTGAHLSMGTPAYMAPEQAVDAAHVDARADIYSLGCTLYDLLTGQPPFIGRTVVEVLTKHQSEPLTPPDVLVRDVPKTLSVILEKMMAKKAADRYQNMGEVIKALEDFLGVGGSGAAFSPKEAHARALEIAVNSFNGLPLARLRGKLIAAFYALCALAVVFCLYKARGDDSAYWLKWAGASVAFAAFSFVSYIVLAGVTQRTHLFLRIRQLVFGARIIDWIKAILVAAMLVGLAMLFDLGWLWLGALVAGMTAAAAFYFAVDLLLFGQRRIFITQIEGMLKKMRMRGLDEDTLRKFVCKFSGKNWEEFYESLFDYQAKMDARRLWSTGERAKDRRKWAAWREPVINWIDQRIRRRKEDKDRRLLARLEERKLRDQGMDATAARTQARNETHRLINKVARVKKNTEDQRSAPTVGPASSVGKSQVVLVKSGSLTDSDADDQPEDRKHETYIQRKYGNIWGLLLGSQVRFFCGVLLVCTFLLWMYQNNPNFLHDLGKRGAQTISATHDDLSGTDRHQPAAQLTDVRFKDPNAALQVDPKYIPGGQPAGLSAILGSWPAGLAGFLLVFSALFGGARIGLVMIVATALILLDGHLFKVPTYNLVGAHSGGMIAGAVIALLGFVFARQR